MSDLMYSDIEEELRDSVRSLLAAQCPQSRVLAMYDGDTSISSELWRAVSTAIDLPGLAIAESYGGGGAAPREVAVVMEELGRKVAPIPFFTSSILAASVLHVCGADDELRELASGTRVAALLVPITTWHVSELRPNVETRVKGLVGHVNAVAGVELADLLLVPAIVDDILTIQCVATPAGSLSMLHSSFDMTRPLSHVTFEGVPSIEIARGGLAAKAISDGLLRAGAMLASEQLGVAEWCLDSTLEYVKQRYQFGRPIGSFQALKHRLAQLWIAVDAARAVARNAAGLCELDGPHAQSAVALAQAYCSDVAVRAAEECIQLHGGIGMTWEHPAHLYLKRAKANQMALGSPALHRADLAKLHSL